MLFQTCNLVFQHFNFCFGIGLFGDSEFGIRFISVWFGMLAVALMAAFALLIGGVCADSLRQETASSYPMPTRRAVGYGIGLAILLAGVGAIALCWVGPWPLWAWLSRSTSGKLSARRRDP